MLNFELFQNVVFIIFVFSNFCTSIGFNVPYVYLAAQAEVLHLTKPQSSWLLGIIGIANTVGRILLGYFSDKAYVNRLLVYNLCLTACGIGECFLSHIYITLDPWDSKCVLNSSHSLMVNFYFIMAWASTKILSFCCDGEFLGLRNSFFLPRTQCRLSLAGRRFFLGHWWIFQSLQRLFAGRFWLIPACRRLFLPFDFHRKVT